MKSASRLEKILESGAFAVTSECGPPRGADPEVACGWQLIVDRLEALGLLEKMYEEVAPFKDWTTSRDGGPRKIVREDMRE